MASCYRGRNKPGEVSMCPLESWPGSLDGASRVCGAWAACPWDLPAAGVSWKLGWKGPSGIPVWKAGKGQALWV